VVENRGISQERMVLSDAKVRVAGMLKGDRAEKLGAVLKRVAGDGSQRSTI